MKEDSPVDRNGHNNAHFQRILPAPSGKYKYLNL
jgi:hypothetical protein